MVASAELRLADAADGTETLLELVDAALGIDELLLAREERVRVRRDAHRDDVVLDTVDLFLLVRAPGGAGDETGARGHVHKDGRLVIRMNVLFHGGCRFPSRFQRVGEAEGARKPAPVKLTSSMIRTKGGKFFGMIVI